MDIIHHPSIILIIGRKRYGKSALGHYIVEKLHTEQGLQCFIVGFPKAKQNLLPDWITPIDNVEGLPDNCIALVDEASFKHHAHKVRGKETEYMDRLIAVSGQKKQTIIFITHTMRKFAITLLLDVDILLCKEPSLLHANLERGEVRKLIEEVKAEFKKLPREDVKKSTYVISDGWKGFMRNPLPSFWSEELSEAWSGIDIQEKEGSDGETRETSKTAIKTLPMRVLNGLRIWFSPEHKHDVLNAFLYHDGGRISEEAVFCTKDKCHLDFDVRLTKDGFYTPSCKNIDFENGLQTLKEKQIPHIVDIEHGDAGFGEFYPLKPEQLVFKEQKKKNMDALDGYAEELKL